jgi:uncharacterized protein
MKKIFLLMAMYILFMIVNCTQNQSYTLKHIYDFEQVLENDQKLKLDELFVKFEQKTGNEIALVTISDYGDNDNIDVYSLDFKAKHVLGKAGKDNSVLIVFSKAKSEVRITPGSDFVQMDKSGTTKYIIDSVMITKFNNKDYFEGLWNGSQKVIDYLEKGK